MRLPHPALIDRANCQAHGHLDILNFRQSLIFKALKVDLQGQQSPRVFNIAVCLPDLAFVDRADIKAYIGLPSLQARYEILRSAVWELARANIIVLPEVGTDSRMCFHRRLLTR